MYSIKNRGWHHPSPHAKNKKSTNRWISGYRIATTWSSTVFTKSISEWILHAVHCILYKSPQTKSKVHFGYFKKFLNLLSRAGLLQIKYSIKCRSAGLSKRVFFPQLVGLQWLLFLNPIHSAIFS